MNKEDIFRERLREKLNKCSTNQIDIFNRMYESIDKIPFEKMEWAEKQIDNTLSNVKLRIEKNLERW